MSKLSDRLTSLGQSAPLKLGFGQAQEKKRNPVLLVVGVSDGSGKAGGLFAHVDLALLRARKGGKPSTAKPDDAEAWGAALSDCTSADLDALKEAGCDFILIESESAPGIALRDDDLGRGLVLPSEVSEARARAIEDLPLDFLFVKDAGLEWPLTLAQVLTVQEKVSTYSKHIFLQVSTPPGKEDLPVLRDMPVSGLVFDLATQDASKLDELRAAIAELEPKKSRSEHIALLPSNMSANAAGHSHEADPDDDDYSDDDP